MTARLCWFKRVWTWRMTMTVGRWSSSLICPEGHQSQFVHDGPLVIHSDSNALIQAIESSFLYQIEFYDSSSFWFRLRRPSRLIESTSFDSSFVVSSLCVCLCVFVVAIPGLCFYLVVTFEPLSSDTNQHVTWSLVKHARDRDLGTHHFHYSSLIDSPRHIHTHLKYLSWLSFVQSPQTFTIRLFTLKQVLRSFASNFVTLLQY